MNNITTLDIIDGVSFSYIKSTKFKVSQISFTFFYPLKEDLVSGFSLLISVLSDSCNKFKNFRDLNKYLEETYGACIDYDIFKVGNYHAISLSVSALDDQFTIEKGQNISKMVDLLCELIFNPLVSNKSFDETVISRRKEEIIELINEQVSDKRTWSIIRCNQEMFKNEPCGISKYGTVSDIEKLDAKKLFDFYKKSIESSRIKIVMIANSDYHDSFEKIRSHFSKVNRKVIPKFEPVSEKIPSSVNELSEKMDVQQCKLVMGFRTPYISSLKDTHSMKLASAIYGGIPTSKLFMSVREKYNLCYYCSSRFDSSTGILYVESGIEEENAQKAKDEIINQLNLIKEGNLSDEEIDDAKKFVIQSTQKISDSINRMCDWYTLKYPANDNETPEEFESKIREVSKQDIVSCMSELALDTIYMITKED